MSVDMSADAVSARLAFVSKVSDLRSEARLAAKVDYSAAAVDKRIRQVAELRRLCLDLAIRNEPATRG